jgi:single-stranded DNA-binding protein
MFNNSVQLKGNLTDDVKVLMSEKSEKEFGVLTIAINESYFDKDSQAFKQKETKFFDAVIFAPKVLSSARALKKGQRILLNGELTNTTQEIDGKKISFIKIEAKDIDVLLPLSEKAAQPA